MRSAGTVTVGRAPSLMPYVVFLSFPIFWFLGLPWLWGPVVGLILLAWLLPNIRSLRLPRAFGLWALFLSWMLLSATQLQGLDRWAAFLLRGSHYLTATVILLYVYNATEEQFSRRALVQAVAMLWGVTILLGVASLVWPGAQFTTLGARILPTSLKSVALVEDQTLPRLSQVQRIFGYPVARPAAPYTYTNGWAANLAFATPFALLSIRQSRSRLWRWFLIALLGIGVVPFVYSVSRAAWVALGLALLYATVRFSLRRGGGSTLVKAALMFTGVAVLVLFSPLNGLIIDRINTPHSNEGRIAQSLEASRRVIESPLVGYGAPLPSEDDPSSKHNVGTHGQLWLVLFSHGIPGLIFYVGWFLAVFWHFRSGRTQFALWVHVLAVMLFLVMPFYGVLSMEFIVLMAAIALGFREEDSAPSPSGRSTELSAVRTAAF